MRRIAIFRGRRKVEDEAAQVSPPPVEEGNTMAGRGPPRRPTPNAEPGGPGGSGWRWKRRHATYTTAWTWTSPRHPLGEAGKAASPVWARDSILHGHGLRLQRLKSN